MPKLIRSITALALALAALLGSGCQRALFGYINRGLPPAVGYVWIDGYLNRIGHRHDWVPGYWAPPGTRARPIVRHRHVERERDEERRERWWRDRREDGRDGDRRREDSRRDERWKDWRSELRDRDRMRAGDGDRDRAGIRDRDGNRAPDFFRERREERDQPEAPHGRTYSDPG